MVGRRAVAVQHNAHGPRTPKHGGRYRYGRGHGRHSLLLHRPLIGEESEGGSDPSLYSNPVVSIGPLFAAAAAAARAHTSARTRARRNAVSPTSSSVTLLTCTARVPPVSLAAVTAARRARARSPILCAMGDVMRLPSALVQLRQLLFNTTRARARNLRNTRELACRQGHGSTRGTEMSTLSKRNPRRISEIVLSC